MFKTNWNKKLLKAAEKGNDTLFQKAMENGADASSKEGFEALYLYCSGKDVTHVRKLLEAGARVIYDNDYAVIKAAARSEDVDFLKKMINTAVEQSNGTITVKQIIDTSRILYELTKQPENSDTFAILNYLLEHDPHLELVDRAGDNPLNNILYCGDKFDMFEILLDAGCDPHSKNSSGKTATDRLRNSSHPRAYELLGRIEPLKTKAPFMPKKAGETKFEKISDAEIMKITSSENGVVLTTVFNFEMSDVVRTQYMPDMPPSPVRVSFNEIADRKILQAAFDKLVELHGNPPSNWKAVKTAKPLPSTQT